VIDNCHSDELYLLQCAEDVAGWVDWACNGQWQSSEALAAENWLSCREDVDELVHILAVPLPASMCD